MSTSAFHPAVQRWFSERFTRPTEPQEHGWAAIRQGRHTLIAAPTGAGKTLAAFLWAIDDLVREAADGSLGDETRVLYVSPLKALSNDVQKNLAEPLAGIAQVAKALGHGDIDLRSAVRTGDTKQSARAAMRKRAPHILVTTPESLYMLVSSASGRAMLAKVRTVIVDEIHAVAANRRGSHLAITLERLDALVGRPVQRIGLSATQKPLTDVARFLVGAKAIGEDGAPDCAIVDIGHRRALDLALEVPRSPLEAVMSNEVWGELYERLVELIREHRTTLVFVSSRRLCERVAHQLSLRLPEGSVTSHHGSLSTALRLDAEQRLKAGALRALVATSSLELGIDIGDVDLVVQLGTPRTIATFLQRVGRAGHWHGGVSKGRLFPLSRDELADCAALIRCVRRGELDRLRVPEQPLDVLAQQIVAAAACEEWGEDELYELMRRAQPYQALTRERFEQVVHMLADGFATQRGRRAALIHYDGVNRRVRARDGARIAALTSGGTIPENADFAVRLEPEGTVIGTVNEDFAIESMAGDVFQLGTSSWRILQVGSGVVRVEDAKGQPPTMPFWLGEGPTRSDELSRAVSALRGEIAEQEREAAITQLTADPAIPRAAAEQLVAYLHAVRDALGAMPTQHTVIAERFFDAAGGMQLVLHSPFGARVNRAWGLALRKRFCRTFNIELQAAATDDSIVISLSTHHSFPLADVFKFLNVRTVRDVLVQAMLDAPLFQVRWRWNAGRALAVLRQRGGKRIPPQFQRIDAEELLGAAFPDQLACQENIVGDREIPDHPLVNQTIDDCLNEAMDFDGLVRLLQAFERGEVRCVAVDLPSPSPAAHEVLNARPYAFLDDAPLEERRTRAVYQRRMIDEVNAESLLDPAAIARVVEEARPRPESADELHDALMLSGALLDAECESARPLLEELVDAGRATSVRPDERTRLWTATERSPQLSAVYARPFEPSVQVPARFAARAWSREEAVRELVRGRLEVCGPITAAALARELALEVSAIDAALVAIEAEGVVLRGRFSPEVALGTGELEWCDRRLLARIHRLTLGRLRAEIEPVSLADFARYLFAWQRVDPSARVRGPDGLERVVRMLDGYELAAGAWEADVLAARVEDYDLHALDNLCLAGVLGWGRLSRGSGDETQRVAALTRASPVALFLREHAEHWRLLAGPPIERVLSAPARAVLAELESRGASFLAQLGRAAGLLQAQVEAAIGELVAAGLVSSDSFAGLRALSIKAGKRLSKRTLLSLDRAGRWSLLPRFESDASEVRTAEAVEAQARVLLARYGVVTRKVVERETNLAPWRDLLRVLRRLEARGEVRGGYFVVGAGGEHFALPEAITSLRSIRREEPRGTYVALSAADPLNLTGVLMPGERVPAIGVHRILFRDAQPVAVLEGRRVRAMRGMDVALEPLAQMTLQRRAVPAALRPYV